MFNMLNNEFDVAFDLLNVLDDRKEGVRVFESSSAYIVEMIAPGYEMSDFDVEVADHNIVINVKSRLEFKKEEFKKVYQSGTFDLKGRTVSLKLKDAVTSDESKAVYKNGILSIQMKKLVVDKKQKIVVTT